MDEKYRLIFRGELLDGQHRAVVKRRLSEALKLKDGQVEKLFSGQPVVLKREVDRTAAAQYQALFKKAGAQLRVKAEAGTGGAVADSASSSAQAAPAATAQAPSGASASDAGIEGRPAIATNVDAPDFKVQSTWFPPPEAPRAEIEAPDYSVAEVGSDLAEKTETPVAAVADVEFDLAEVGADLLTGPSEAPAVTVASVDFEIAEVGADIGTPRLADDAQAPDVSHIALVEP